MPHMDFRRARVHGRRAEYWHRSNGHLVLRHPNGRETTDIPFPHLTDEALMAEHIARLREKRWVSAGAIDELVEIAKGGRRDRE